MMSTRFSTACLVISLALVASGCSLFFNPDDHVGTDAGGDSGRVDGGMDSSIDSGDTGVEDSGAGDVGPDADFDAAVPFTRVCSPGTLLRGTPLNLETTFEVSVALTNTGSTAHMGYIDGDSAMISSADFTSLDTAVAWNVSDRIDVVYGESPRPAMTFAIRRTNGADLAVVIAGSPASTFSTKTGFFVGTSLVPGEINGFVLDSMGAALGEGVPYATLTGGAPDHASDGRAIFVEELGDVGGGAAVASLPWAGGTYATLGMGFIRGAFFTAGSSGRLAFVVTPEVGRFRTVLWSGFGAAWSVPEETSDIPHHSHLALVSGDTYLLSRFNPGRRQISHQLLECDFVCTGGECGLDAGCTEGAFVVELEPPEDVQISAHHAANLGVAVVTAELNRESSTSPLDTKLVLEFLLPDLTLVDDMTGAPFRISLGDFPGTSPGAIDVDVWVEGSTVRVLAGIYLIPDDGPFQLMMIGWQGELCP